MVQHITITPNAAQTEPQTNPETALLWRDDQTLKWGLAEGYSWPNPVEGPQVVPIVFLPAFEDYADWPGSTPTAIGPRPDPGTPDRRFYVATSDAVMEPGEELIVQKYHYAFVVCPADTPGCMLTIDPNATTHPSSWTDGNGVWHDPDVENQNQP